MTWPETVVQLLRGDDGKKERSHSRALFTMETGSRQKLLKRVGHDLVFTQASLPWPAGPWYGIVYSPWGGICEAGVGCTGVVWDVQPIGIFWLCKEVRPLQAGYGCRAIATILPFASPQKKTWHLRKYAQRGEVRWQGDRYHTFAFEPAKGTMWMTYTKRPDFKTLQTR